MNSKIVCETIVQVKIDSFVFEVFSTLVSSVNHRDDPDQDWKPHHKARPSHRDDNGDESSTDDSEFELLREEAAEFAHDASTRHSRPAKKKAKLNLHDPEEE